MRRGIILPLAAVVLYLTCLVMTRKAPEAPDSGISGVMISERTTVSGNGTCRIEAKDMLGSGIIIYMRTDGAMDLPEPGDTLVIKDIRPKEIRNYNDFDYRSHMARKGYFYSCYCRTGDCRIIRCNTPSAVHAAGRMRDRLKTMITELIPDKNSSSIIVALATADKSLISKELRDAYSSSGASHILALSGLHVGIIYKILSWCLMFLNFLPGGERIRSVAVIFILWVYAAFTGMGASIVRAVIMASIYETGGLIGRERNASGALALSAIILLLISPQNSRNLSFILSFEAMTGILLFYPVMKRHTRHIKTNVFIRKVLDTCLLSISCQILTAPQIFVSFGNFSHYFLLCNILVMPLTNIIMILIPITITTSSCSPAIGGTAACILDLSVKVLNWIVETISQLNGSFSLL